MNKLEEEQELYLLSHVEETYALRNFYAMACCAALPLSHTHTHFSVSFLVFAVTEKVAMLRCLSLIFAVINILGLHHQLHTHTQK